MWLVGASYIMVAASSEVRYMTGMIVAGLAAGAVPILAPVVRAFRLYAIPLLGASP